MQAFRKLKIATYIHYFFEDFILIYPFYAIMFQENGLDSSLFSVLMMIWVLAVMIFEIPSGIIADKFNRRNIVIFGEIIRAIGYVIWIVYPTFTGYAIGFIFWGFKSALRSGALEALIYDNLTVMDKKDEYLKISSNARILSVISIILATATAGIFVDKGYLILVIVGNISLVIASVSLLFIKDYRLYHEKPKSYIKEGFKHLKNNKIIQLVILGQIFYIMGMLDEYWGLYAYEFGYTKAEIAILITILMVFEALIIKFAHKMRNATIEFIPIIVGISVLFTTKSPIAFFIVLAISNGLFKVSDVIVNSRFQDEFKGSIRATVTSIRGFFDEIFCITFYGVLALISLNDSYEYLFRVSGLIMIVLGLVMYVYKKKIS